jgi:Asp-tRNA(Asn)/Glu-tRNA(Gln) amidotransferase A subunit family amidase
MRLGEYAAHDGLGLAALVARSEVTARELGETAIAAVNPRLNGVIEAELRYNITSRQVARLFETFDVLVTPTCTVPPLPTGAVDLDRPGASVRDLFDHLAPIETFTALFNATGQPAISVPLMLSAEGLPGMTMIAACAWKPGCSRAFPDGCPGLLMRSGRSAGRNAMPRMY